MNWSACSASAFPMNWPIGNGPDFKASTTGRPKTMHTFERVVGGKYRAPSPSADCTIRKFARKPKRTEFAKTVEELEMLELAGNRSMLIRCSLANHARLLRQRREQLRRATFARWFPETFAPRPSRVSWAVSCAGESGVQRFHLQDSGEHGSEASRPHRVHPRLLRQIRARRDRASLAFREKVRLSSSHKLFGNERETVDEAYPGDVIGLVGTTVLASATRSRPIRNSLEKSRASRPAFRASAQSEHREVQTIPPGPRSAFAGRRDPGAYLRNSSVKTPLLAAVGPLQFEVVQFRLESEYGAESRLESAPGTSCAGYRPT